MAKKIQSKQTKYIIVTGGVLSGIGKGITAASLGALLNCAGQKVSMQKLELYLSVDSGLLSPREHGECFVTADGKETDLDLLKTGSYTTICRFDRAIDKVEQATTKINPARTAAMLKVNTYDLQKNNSLLDNCIYLTPLKNK